MKSLTILLSSFRIFAPLTWAHLYAASIFQTRPHLAVPVKGYLIQTIAATVLPIWLCLLLIMMDGRVLYFCIRVPNYPAFILLDFLSTYQGSLVCYQHVSNETVPSYSRESIYRLLVWSSSQLSFFILATTWETTATDCAKDCDVDADCPGILICEQRSEKCPAAKAR